MARLSRMSQVPGGAEFVEGWNIIQTLGEGAFGDVKLLISSDGETVAMKTVDLMKHPEAVDNVRKEICTHRMLVHPNVIKFLGQRKENFIQYIFLEYASGGELFDRIEPDVGMEPVQAQKYFLQLLSGVEYLHGHGVAHRDLKPENLLLDESDNLKISDFGMATIFRHKGQERTLEKRCGTLPYVAPEVLQKPYHAEPADVWSCGIILVAMLAGELPWDYPGVDCQEYLDWKESHKSLMNQRPWSKFDPIVFSLFRKILQPLPSRRYKICQIKEHPWMKKAKLRTLGGGSSESSQWPFLHSEASPPKRLMSEGDFAGSGSPMNGAMSRLASSQPDPAVVHTRSPVKLCKNQAPVFSFSQPAQPDDMILSTQMNATQMTCSQNGFQKLVKRMTRFFVSTDMAETLKRLDAAAEALAYRSKVSSPGIVRLSPSPSLIHVTLSTMDRRKMPLAFKATLMELEGQILVDLRLSRGDGLEFKRHFLSLKKQLADIVVKGLVTWPLAAATNTLP
ncbi:unnamed protein product [Darwinula stevensoni]|uniref:non-specific serine/threonine protein kinase n=1 Tax=Darwinula stevensoni TaxID=69355 RepID=A0A7R8X3G9_9CRUS|nr:unnamed protein product [Darwinula stevensoni]CAG0884961.1 unnamed protein product [Darwinula stevensoni]